MFLTRIARINANSICKMLAHETMNRLPFLGRIEMPLFIWVTDWIALLFAGTVSIIWPIAVFESPHSHLMWASLAIWLIPLAALVAGIIDYISQIITSKLGIQEDGIYESLKTGTVLMKWQDVVRYEPGRKGGFALFFRNGDRIEIPGCCKDSESIRNYCLQKIEQIGTFEDGRKVPRILFSISYKGLFLLLLAIFALAVVVIELIK